MNEEAIYSEGASSSSRSTTGSGSGKEVEDAIPPTSLPRLYSVDQEIGGPPPALKVRLMREKHVHYLINGAFEMRERERKIQKMCNIFEGIPRLLTQLRAMFECCALLFESILTLWCACLYSIFVFSFLFTVFIVISMHVGLGSLGPSYVCLDASRPWIIYWVSAAPNQNKEGRQLGVL